MAYAGVGASDRVLDDLAFVGFAVLETERAARNAAEDACEPMAFTGAGNAMTPLNPRRADRRIATSWDCRPVVGPPPKTHARPA